MTVTAALPGPPAGRRYPGSVGSKGWVLVTDGDVGQSRASLAAVRALAAAGYSPAATVCGPFSLAGASRHCRRRIPVPPSHQPGYETAVRGELASRSYVAVLPSSDAACLALQPGARPLIDKLALAERARACDLAFPPTVVIPSWEALLDRGADLEFPLVVKESLRRSPALRIESPAALERADRRTGPLLVQPYLTDGVHAIAGVVWDGRLLAAAHQRYLRIWPPDCGMSSAAETVDPDLPLEGRLLALLDGHRGIFQAQFAGPYLLDVNPRVYGSLPLAVSAGVNLPGIHCDLVRGAAEPGAPVRARSGVFYRWIEGDVRNLAHAVRTRRRGPVSALFELRPHRGAAHSTESLSDPKPMGVRLRYAMSVRRKRAAPARISQGAGRPEARAESAGEGPRTPSSS